MWLQILVSIAVKLLDALPAIILATKEKGKMMVKRFK